jgi:hypothetical protein
MKDKKTRRLTCIVTGKVLFASKIYYEKKLSKAESENELHDTYMCQDAKMLLKKGHGLDYINNHLPIEDGFECTISEEELKEIVSKNDTTLKFRLNNSETSTVGVIKTDPDVKKFIKNILNDGT